MKASDLKYLIAYTLPLATLLGIHWRGGWSYAGLVLAFAIIPALEILIPTRAGTNHAPEAEGKRLSNHFFDYLLYLNIPLLYGIIAYYFYTLTHFEVSTFEYTGLLLSVGITVGVTGINVAHELGHRSTRWEQLLAQIQLIPALYTHFFVEHNRGHHKQVATDHDPASARYGEVVYFFWLRSLFLGYLSAWRLEAKRMRALGHHPLHWRNQMIWMQSLQIVYLFLVGWYFGWAIVPAAIGIGLIGILNLETVNYIEHYGLRRQKLASGRYEPVQPYHSWNSDHEVGRIFLYELTRHSDHHFRAARKYQILRRFEESPQLPHGYPASMLLSLVPPLWFRVMNPKVKNFQRNLVISREKGSKC